MGRVHSLHLIAVTKTIALALKDQGGRCELRRCSGAQLLGLPKGERANRSPQHLAVIEQQARYPPPIDLPQ